MAVTPNTGKTSARYARFLSNGYDLSGDMRTLSELGTRFDQTDVTGWADEIMQFLADTGEVVMAGMTALMNNTPAGTGPTAAGAHQVLSASGTFINSVFLGVRAIPAIGDPSFAAVFEQGGYTINGGKGAPVMVEGNFHGTAILPQSLSVWGVALAAGAELTATGNGGSVDNGAESTGGYIAVLHLPQTTGAMDDNDWEFAIQHSTNDSSFTTLATFTADGSEITAERLEDSGTVNRYVRLASTRTAGTARPWVTFIRK